jgi:putative SOS response-associated peptidase YedK
MRGKRIRAVPVPSHRGAPYHPMMLRRKQVDGTNPDPSALDLGSTELVSMDQQGRPNEPQLVYRRDPETRRPVEGYLRWGLIPHFCEKRPDFAPIHARAETVAENEWFSDAYRERRCVVPMNSFLQEDSSGKRYAISRQDGEPIGVAGFGQIGAIP